MSQKLNLKQLLISCMKIVHVFNAVTITTASYVQSAKRVNALSPGCQTHFDTKSIFCQTIIKSIFCQTLSTLHKLENSTSVS